MHVTSFLDSLRLNLVIFLPIPIRSAYHAQVDLPTCLENTPGLFHPPRPDFWGGILSPRDDDITQLQVYQPPSGISWPHVVRIPVFFPSKRKGLQKLREGRMVKAVVERTSLPRPSDGLASIEAVVT